MKKKNSLLYVSLLFLFTWCSTFLLAQVNTQVAVYQTSKNIIIGMGCFSHEFSTAEINQKINTIANLHTDCCTSAFVQTGVQTCRSC